MGASNDLTALLVIVWLFGLIFVLASLFRPVPPFRSRTQAFFLGLPGILIGPFVIAIALGWAPALGTKAALQLHQNLNQQVGRRKMPGLRHWQPPMSLPQQPQLRLLPHQPLKLSA